MGVGLFPQLPFEAVHRQAAKETNEIRDGMLIVRASDSDKVTWSEKQLFVAV